VSGAYSAGNIYNTGVTNNGTQNGTIIFEVPYNAPQLYYVCQNHSMMAGSIIVSDLGPTGPQGPTGPIATGPTGLEGPTGPGFSYQGPWAAQTYQPYSAVEYGSIIYALIDLAPYYSATSPDIDTAHWAVFGGGGGGGAVILGDTTAGNLLTATGISEIFGNQYLTFTGGVLSVGAPTVGAAANSINVQGGYYVNGVLQTSGGGGGVTIAGSANTGNLLTATGTSGGVFGNSDLVLNSGILSLTGGFRLTNGFRPPYVEVKTGTSITPAANSYGTYYDIQTSAITGLSIGYPVTGSNNWSNDANAGWLFRNNSGGYLSLTVTYTSATPNIYPLSITIPPDTGVTLLAVYPGGGSNSNYVLF